MLETIRVFVAGKRAGEPALRDAHAGYFLGPTERAEPYPPGGGQGTRPTAGLFKRLTEKAATGIKLRPYPG
ncbi:MULTISPECIES: hypothetical protein [unclassified Streptomyces]|uniref:hypothetical protein n=1 Tax=unclassified Streptomyces TaxID=2593676 RepID=UPI00382C281A